MGTALAFVALLLAASEAGSRLFVPQWAPTGFRGDDFWRHDPLLGWSHVPLARGRFVGHDFSVRVAINSRGLRDRDYPLAPAPGRRRVVVLGDSFGWGWGVEHEETFEELLEARIPGVDFINCSIIGYGTDQQYLFLQSHCLAYRPQIVLLLMTPNDVVNNGQSRQYGYSKPFFELVDGTLVRRNDPVPELGPGRKLESYLLRKGYFLRELYVGGRRLAGLVAGLVTGADTNAPVLDYTRAETYAVTDALLLAIDRLSRRHGARLMVAGVPAQEAGLEQVPAHFKAFLPTRGIAYLSLEEAFWEATESTIFPHDYHWNPYGHRLAAGAIERALRDQVRKTP